jgi:putative glutamine amidotransferase
MIEGELHGCISSSFTSFLSSLGCRAVSFLPTAPTYLPGYSVEGVGEGVEVEEWGGKIDGVLLQGGNDLDPRLYGEEMRGSVDPQPFRDGFELKVIEYALKYGIPIFGVCRGFQLLNVALGGALIQHLEAPFGQTHRLLEGAEGSVVDNVSLGTVLHKVEITEGGVLSDILAVDSITVNSVHHQSVKRVGSQLRLEGVAPDGIIEAVSDRAKKILAVQWHPEYDFTQPQFAKPLKWWVDNWVVA